ncbi:hypothetical protein H4R35_000096 [Dimargaris xerosporica]|nr:hypothetical protein H4R35_000096 [Dimargaris xerosporica]
MGNGYNIAGVFVKSEYLVLGTFTGFGLLGYGIKKKFSNPTPNDNKPPIVASSQEEEDFIKEFIKLAETDDQTAKNAAH